LETLTGAVEIIGGALQKIYQLNNFQIEGQGGRFKINGMIVINPNPSALSPSVSLLKWLIGAGYVEM